MFLMPYVCSMVTFINLFVCTGCLLTHGRKLARPSTKDPETGMYGYSLL
jgi:hypothetical protein